jgi:hypothetical protein
MSRVGATVEEFALLGRFLTLSSIPMAGKIRIRPSSVLGFISVVVLVAVVIC